MPATGYTRPQILLHWGAAVLIVLQFVGHEAIAEAWDQIEEGLAPAFNPLVAGHVLGGILVLVFALWRLSLRRRVGAPPPPAEEPPLAQLAAKAGHAALYALMIAMPVSGAVAWFGGVEAAAEAHELMKPLMLLLVAVHVAAALWHQFWLKDNLIARMKHPVK